MGSEMCIRDRSNIPKINSNKYVGQDYGDLGGGIEYPERNRMAYTLNLEDSPYGGGIPERNYFGQRNRDIRPNSRANHENMYKPRQMEMTDDPRYPSNLDDIGQFRASLYNGEGMYSRGMEGSMGRKPEMQMNMGGNQERDNGFDAAKKLEKYKNQMNMKFGGDNGYGGRFY